MKRRPCRAAACPRKVDKGVLFCPVHLPQLTPAQQAGLNGNRELPPTVTAEARRTLADAIGRSVGILAKKEGRAEDLRRAINSQTINPAEEVTGSTSDGAGTNDRGYYQQPSIREQ